MAEKKKIPELKAELRDLAVKAKAVRLKGMVPAVMYGPEGDNFNISIERLVLNRLVKEVSASQIIELEIDNEKYEVLIHDIFRHPVTMDVDHIDFYRVKKGQELTADIGLDFIGESDAIIVLQGALFTNIDSVEVRALPRDLVPSIEVDISSLKEFTDSIHVSDIKTPEGITITTLPETLVARVEEQLEVVEEEPIEEVDLDSIETTNEKPSEEGADGTEAPAPATDKEDNK